MPTSFTIVSGNSVPSNYSWDYGTPLSSIPSLVGTEIFPQGNTINGYAPAVKIFVQNNSSLTTQTTEFTAISSLYSWDFGDYYNTKNNNYTTPCSGAVSHVYIIPNIYTITLTRYETGLQYNPVAKKVEVVTNVEVFPENDNEKNSITILNILPSAGFFPITPSIGTAPHSVQFTAKTTIPGSFPIDKIVWDFGDGSPLLTVSRYITAVNNQLIQTNTFSSDPADPRNFEPVHIYQRLYNEYSIFYPSITAYSGSTADTDTCSNTIGPIFLPNLNELKILKSKSTTTGSFYAIKNNNSVAFVSTLTSSPSEASTTIKLPTGPIRNSSAQPILYSGNSGTDYYTVDIIC
jgi:hypothetical protein